MTKIKNSLPLREEISVTVLLSLKIKKWSRNPEPPKCFDNGVILSVTVFTVLLMNLKLTAFSSVLCNLANVPK